MQRGTSIGEALASLPEYSRLPRDVEECSSPEEPPPEEAKVPRRRRPIAKTKLCRFAPYGTCKNGDWCPFAHGYGELDDSSPPLQQRPQAKRSPPILNGAESLARYRTSGFTILTRLHGGEAYGEVSF